MGSADSRLVARRLAFERVRTLWEDKVGTWIAIDFEQWEMDSTVITELGWSRVRWQDGEIVEDMGHWIIEENRQYRNTKYVPDKRDVSGGGWLLEVLHGSRFSSTTTLARARC